MKSGFRKVSKMMKKFMPKKRREKNEVKKRRSRTFALESQIWRADINRLCREFDQDFEDRKMTLPPKWRNVQRTNTVRIQKSITPV